MTEAEAAALEAKLLAKLEAMGELPQISAHYKITALQARAER